MDKIPKTTEISVLMYLHDALVDKSAMEHVLNEHIYQAAITDAQQASEKAVKACLLIKSERSKDPYYQEVDPRKRLHKGHDYMHEFKGKIIETSGELKPKFMALNKDITYLETWSSRARYSVDESGAHLRQYPEIKVTTLCRSASEFIELCFLYVEKEIGKQIPRDIRGLDQFIEKNYPGYFDRPSL